MFDIFNLASARFIVALNHWLAANASLYQLAWVVTDRGVDLLILITLALLWFWPKPKEREYLFPYPQARPSHAQQLRMQWMTELSREASRAQILVLITAGVLCYVAVQLLAFELSTPRPFATALPVREGIAGAFESVPATGSFPASQAVWLGAIPAALLFWDRRLAYIWTGLAAVLALFPLALGFHFPLDMIAGAALGVLITYGALSWYRQRGKFGNTFLNIARGFDLAASPYCFILYVLLLLGAVEFLMHFQHLLEGVFTLRSEIVTRIASKP